MNKTEICVLLGTGAIGLGVTRAVACGKHVLLTDLKVENAKAAAKTLVANGFEVSTAAVDITSKESIENLTKKALSLGEVTQVIVATGVSPSTAPPSVVLKVDLYGVALALEVFGQVISSGGAGLVIGSQAGHRLKALTYEEDNLIAKTPVDELLKLDIFNSKEAQDSLYAYQLAKRGSSLRVKREAVRWGKRGARINMISPGIVMSPLADEEFKSQNKEQYQRMIEECPVKRTGSPEEVAALANVLMGENGGFITGSDFLMDGGVTAVYLYGDGSMGELK